MRKRLLALVMVSMFALGSLSLGPMQPDGIQQSAEGSQVRAGPAFAFDHYHNYTEIKSELERVSDEHPDITQVMILGRTWEGRDIMALRVTDGPDSEEMGEPDVLIMGAHHANELPSAEVPMYVLEFLVENYAINSTVRELVNNRDIWFVPLVNPDGREYAMGTDPAWRKNRRPIDLDGDRAPEGTGVDLNRNYGHYWSLQGTSTNPTSSNYCGPSAFSENETIAIRQLAISQGFELSLSYHTFGEQVSYTWNNGIDTLNPREDVLKAIADDLAERTGYTPMEGKDLYLTTGDSDDWLYSETSTLAFTIELCTQYVPPPEQLETLCQLNLEAALYAADIAEEPEKTLLPDWTFMVYMSADADSGLAGEAFVDLNEMEAAGSTPDVNIIVLYDGLDNGDSAIYRVEKDPGGFNSAIITPKINDLGAVIDPVTQELDMSKWATLRNFTTWATDNYPAQKYLLSIWGHGDGVLQDIVPDKGTGMKVGDIHQALEGFDIDIVGFDTCSLGHFEVAAELVGIADIMIGSEAKEPLPGWDYQASLQKVVLKPSTGPKTLAWYIISDYFAANTESYITQAAIDIQVFNDDFLPLLNDFAEVSQDFALLDKGKIWAARNITDTFVTQEDAVDLFQFLENLDAQEISASVMSRLQRLLDIKDELVFASGSGTAHPLSRSMAVYFPLLDDPIPSEYNDMKFCQGGWNEYLAGAKSPNVRPIITSQQQADADNTVGPYNVLAQVVGYNDESISLYYRVNGGAWQTTAMSHTGGWLGSEIPGQSNGSVIEFYILDATDNITEPYEIKWGGGEYLKFDVNASCDLFITSIILRDQGTLMEGNNTAFMVNCSNIGPEPVTANVTVAVDGAPNQHILSVRQVSLAAHEWVNIEANWTSEPGTWKVIAAVQQDMVFDRNASNQEATLWVNVTANGTVNDDFLTQYGFIIVVLIILWGATVASIMLMLRRARAKRQAAARQLIANAREFLRTAAEFGGDVNEAGMLLARAEAALARNALPESERLVKKARESAMNAVGQKEAP